MDSTFFIYNSLSRRKEEFRPLDPPFVGVYVCGPTVYGDPHLGHARSAVTFDLLFRWLLASGFKVRYVRNITDVGHLVNDADEGEDKILKKARLEQLEPMEVAQYYTNRYHDMMRMMNVLPPSIEPHASGHIIEQIELVKEILKSGYAYESNGSVYFDVENYNRDHKYGKLSGRVLDELQTGTRDTEGQGDKRHAYDFALWKRASSEHIMRWPSPWSEGFPGWHLECSAMSTKYLGEHFDIHGGGMDLLFPHHECEIAQNTAAHGSDSARCWMHNNMITINGQKMGKSLGNSISLDEFFTGTHPLLTQAYRPTTIRFFILQAHYRSTLDFSNEALQAAEKGLERLMKGVAAIGKIKPSAASTVDVAEFDKAWRAAMNDDLNSSVAISVLFDWVRIINQLNDGQQQITAADLETLTESARTLVFDVLGLQDEAGNDRMELVGGLMGLILDIRSSAKANKDWPTSDKIRDALTALGIKVKDGREGSDWEFC
ncbi:MAG: cysteine--tRNA ligase [Rikenellaceae bacterium]|nr:cysteine--tRNA ligase [Rikenellaceae bacterium]